MTHYHELWEEGRNQCEVMKTDFNPAREFVQSRVPVETVKAWFDLGTAQKLKLERYNKTYWLSFELLCFTTDQKEDWRESHSEPLDAATEDEAMIAIEALGLLEAYHARVTDGYLNW